MDIFKGKAWSGLVTLMQDGSPVLSLNVSCDPSSYTSGARSQVFGGWPLSVVVYADVGISPMVRGSQDLDRVFERVTSLTFHMADGEVEIEPRHPIETHDSHGLSFVMRGDIVSLARHAEVPAEA